jgi:CBS domain containing-hemolysin-like protein
LFATFVLTAFVSALRSLQKRQGTEELQERGHAFFFRPLLLYFFPDHEYEGSLIALLSTLSLSRFLLAFFLATTLLIQWAWTWVVLLILALSLVLFLLTDYLPRALGSLYPEKTLFFLSPCASIFLCLAFPLIYPFIRLSLKTFKEPFHEARQEIFDILQESDLKEKLEPQDKKLIESVVLFRDRIVREVMVPRIDLFSLPVSTSIKEAAIKLQKEGYSRTPVYQGTIDHILGVLMYKDILVKYMEAADKSELKILDEPIEPLIKPVIYTPETKKISHLLQEFRKKQLHLAIVVDEYGGTEGIVTIEDILEEIVGDIADEYDVEEDLFITLPDGSLIVDARMSILDLEQQLDISIPEEGDFDTLGGYIFQKAGEIPTRGFVIRQDDFDLEVVRAGERTIEKVKITKKAGS